MTASRPFRIGAATAVALVLVGCTSPSPVRTPPLSQVAGWQELALPEPGARVLVLAPIGDALLALGSVPGPAGRAPAGWQTTDGHSWHRLTLAAATGYGQQAEFIMAGVTPGHIAAYGQAFGGAHSSARPTLWTGDAEHLTEHEQSFVMFGGEDAIAVSAEAARPGRVLLAGSWDGRSGRYDAAVWLSPDGATWTRYADAPGLAAGPHEQTAAYGAAATSSGFVVVGDSERTGATLRTSALAWTSSDGRAWQRTILPASGNAIAARTDCDADGCIVLGSTAEADQHLLCWTLNRAAQSTPAVDGPGHGLVQVTQALLFDERAYVISDVDHVATLAVADRKCAGWTSVKLPEPVAQATLAPLDGHLILSTTGDGPSRLWLRS